VLELQGHGGPVVLQMLLARVLEAGPRRSACAWPSRANSRAAPS
jgi:tRNA U34 5-carboxymethylaminomethyl modifying GTPase MnmE/TrmE